MLSLSSSIVVAVPVSSATSSSPPSKGGIRAQWTVVLSAATVPTLMRQNCSRHCCSSSKQGNLNLIFPLVLEGFCRQLLSILECFGVCCTLHGSRNRLVWPPDGRPDQWTIDNTLHSKTLEFPPVVVVFRSKAACAASPRAAAALEDTSRAALRPGSAAVVKISACVDVASVDPHGSVVTPESASFQASEQRVCTRVVASRGFGSAASFSMFQLRVQGCSTQTTPAVPVQL